ncbi:MAG: YCF48-related protein [Bacteroidota bacterium]
MKQPRPFLIGLFLLLSSLLSVRTDAQTIEQFYPDENPNLGMIRHLAFAPENPTLGYAVGHCGSFLSTLGQANQWENIGIEGSPDLELIIVFPGYDGDRLVAFSQQQDFFSDDSGMSWQAGQLQLSPEDGTITDAFALDKQNAILACSSGRIYRSRDAGRTWQATDFQSERLASQSMDFVNDKRGWVGDTSGQLFQTTDGGDSWERIRTDTLPYFSLSAYNDTLFYASSWTGVYKFAGQPLTMSQFLKWSLDEENKVTTFDESGFYVYDQNKSLIRFFSASLELPLLVFSPQPDQKVFSSRSSVHGGYLWTYGMEHRIQRWETTTFRNRETVYQGSVEDGIRMPFFPNPSEVLLTAQGSSNKIRLYQAEQDSWTELADQELSSPNYVIGRPDGSILLASFKELATIKDGQIQILRKAQNETFVCLKRDPFGDKMYLLIIPRTGTSQLYSSVDQGDSWTLVKSFNFLAISLEIPEQDVIYAYGLNDMDRSEDGGLNWSVVLSQEDFQIRQVKFFSRDLGLITLNDQILRTTDGGLNFELISFPDLYNPNFQSERIVWGQEGRYGEWIVRSQDGGRSWERIVRQDCSPFFNIRINPCTGDIWLVSAAGNVQIIRNEELPFHPITAEGQDFLIFPNPSDGLFHLGFPADFLASDDQLELYNITGQLLQRIPLRQERTQAFDWRFLSPGTYVVRLRGRSLDSSQKIVIQ